MKTRLVLWAWLILIVAILSWGGIQADTPVLLLGSMAALGLVMGWSHHKSGT